jgi:hypothetical protein
VDGIGTNAYLSPDKSGDADGNGVVFQASREAEGAHGSGLRRPHRAAGDTQGGKSVVMLSLKEYERLEETLHLLGDPVNAEHLRRSMAQAEAGEFVEFDDIQ